MNKNIVISLILLIILGLGVFFYLDSTLKSPPETNEMMFEEDEMMKDNTSGIYTDFSPTAYADAKNKTRVLFFHAKWCPTCKAANEDFEKNKEKIPQDVVVFKTDYDNEKELKAKYNITYQHTFVEVDENGYALKVWNGGGVSELVENLDMGM